MKRVASGEWRVASARGPRWGTRRWLIGVSLATRHSPLATRAGVSLLEVLISIFVIMVGMLGVAAVIPAGRAELVEAAKADRSSVCGASAAQFLQTSSYFDPRKWTNWDTSSPAAVVVYPTGTAAIPFTGTNSGAFVVDPLYYAKQWASTTASTTTLHVFPIPAGGTIPTVRVGIPLLGTPTVAPTRPYYLAQAIAERFFLGQDDLVMAPPKDRTERPRQLMIDSTATPRTLAVPVHAADALPYAPTAPMLVRQAQGDYSWMFTVCPLAAEPDFINGGTPYLNVGMGEYYSVSAAVFYKRNFNPDTALAAASPDTGEPFGVATFSTTYPNPSVGGGDVTLISGTSATAGPVGWLDVKANEWLLLGGYTAPCAGGYQRYVLRWYRIVAVGDIAPAGTVAGFTVPTRPVTLAGPDWDLTTGALTAGLTVTADVVLYRGVVDVHTTTMKLIQ